MLELFGKRICEFCFSDIDANGMCSKCMMSDKTRDSFALKLGSVLNGRYIIGKQLYYFDPEIIYVAYDNKTQSSVEIRELFFSEFNLRAGDGHSICCSSPENDSVFDSEKQLYTGLIKYLAKLNTDPNTINVSAVFFENNTIYSVSNYLVGSTIKDYMSKNNYVIAEFDCKTIIPSISLTLEKLNENNIPHCPITADSIFVCENSTVLLYKFASTRNNRIIPSTGVKAEIAQFGNTVYFMLTNAYPTPEMRQNINLPDWNRLNTAPTLKPIVQKMLTVSPNIGYSYLDEIISDIKNLSSVAPLVAPEANVAVNSTGYSNPNVANNTQPQGFMPNTTSKKKRNIIIIAASALLLVIAVGITLFALRDKIKKPPISEDTPTVAADGNTIADGNTTHEYETPTGQILASNIKVCYYGSDWDNTKPSSDELPEFITYFETLFDRNIEVMNSTFSPENSTFTDLEKSGYRRAAYTEAITDPKAELILVSLSEEQLKEDKESAGDGYSFIRLFTFTQEDEKRTMYFFCSNECDFIPLIEKWRENYGSFTFKSIISSFFEQ